MFEQPQGIKEEICFIAHDVPSMGYRVFLLTSGEPLTLGNSDLKVLGTSIENQYFRIMANECTGEVYSIQDKVANRELLDGECIHSFNMIVVRGTDSIETSERKFQSIRARMEGSISVALEIISSALGHPRITQTIRLYTGNRRIHVENRILKDATPLLDVHIVFPFKLDNPEFRYEGTLSHMTPITDYLPGSHSDTIAIQNWVRASQDGFNILWSSQDAPIVNLGNLWPGYTSPAHSCVFPREARHDPLAKKDMTKGWIYSEVFSNNYGTNFSVSQVADVLFRYIITSSERDVTDSEASHFGWECALPLEAIFTNRNRHSTLPMSASLMTIDNDHVVLLSMKKDPDDNAYILRLWNQEPFAQVATLRLRGYEVTNASLLSIAEEDLGQSIECNEDGLCINLNNSAVITCRIKVKSLHNSDCIEEGSPVSGTKRL
jgi:alpha-mannosidase